MVCSTFPLRIRFRVCEVMRNLRFLWWGGTGSRSRYLLLGLSLTLLESWVGSCWQWSKFSKAPRSVQGMPDNTLNKRTHAHTCTCITHMTRKRSSCKQDTNNNETSEKLLRPSCEIHVACRFPHFWHIDFKLFEADHSKQTSDTPKTSGGTLWAPL